MSKIKMDIIKMQHFSRKCCILTVNIFIGVKSEYFIGREKFFKNLVQPCAIEGGQ